MPCDTRLKKGQTISQRAAEVRKVVERVSSLVASGNVRVVVDKKTGGVAFTGLVASERDDVTDACIYRRLMATGSALARAQIAKAEQMAGRTVDRQAIAAGVHSHDGGRSWHQGH